MSGQKWIKIKKPISEYKLYRQGEVPEDLKGRGVWRYYGNERLFSPFSGRSKLIESNWKCKTCGREWFYQDIIKNHNAHCPTCGEWVGLKGLKFNGVQKKLEEFR